MKIKELITEDEESGTFAGVRFSKPTQDRIKQYGIDNNIPNALPREKMHVTLLYSKKPCPNYVPSQEPYPMTATPDHFEIWKSTHIEGTPNCLVLKLKSPELISRHKELMKEHDADFGYPEYIPHMTVSYDIGDMTSDDLPDFEGKLDIEREYQEDLRTEYKSDELTKPHPGK